MNMIICGAGEVGWHVAETFAARKNNITMIDQQPERLRAIEDALDVRTLLGNAADAEVLLEAGAETADLVLASTDRDEVNLLSASIAKGVGAAQAIARVHHPAYFEQRGLDYQRHLGIDWMICPEYATSQAMARLLRNPGALAIEEFARGRIELQEFHVGESAPGVGRRLIDVEMPPGCRLAAVKRDRQAFLPEATTVVLPDDSVVMVGNRDVFQQACRQFAEKSPGRRKIVLMGGTPMAVWLCRSLREQEFAIRLFETNRARAEQLANELDWVTIIQADPTDRTVFQEEHLSQADVFVALLDDDEANIIGCVLAKSLGVSEVMAVVQRSNFLDLLYDIGVDRPFSPRMVAAKEIEELLDESPLRQIASLAAGYIDVFRVRIGAGAEVLDRPLREIRLTPQAMIVAVQRGRDVHVPAADDVLQARDIVLVVGKHGEEATLRKVFDAR
jgi:trk system potassium uptake protein TrkA